MTLERLSTKKLNGTEYIEQKTEHGFVSILAVEIVEIVGSSFISEARL